MYYLGVLWWKLATNDHAMCEYIALRSKMKTMEHTTENMNSVVVGSRTMSTVPKKRKACFLANFCVSNKNTVDHQRVGIVTIQGSVRPRH